MEADSGLLINKNTVVSSGELHQPTVHTQQRCDHFFCHFQECWGTANSWYWSPQWHREHMMEDSGWQWNQSREADKTGGKWEKTGTWKFWKPLSPWIHEVSQPVAPTLPSTHPWSAPSIVLFPLACSQTCSGDSMWPEVPGVRKKDTVIKAHTQGAKYNF